MYKGDYKAGVRQGQGKEINEKGDSYEGAFNRDKKDGKGVQTIASNGTKYEGTFFNDVKHGYVKVTTSDGKEVYKFF